MSYTPNESSQAIYLEHTWLQGTIISSVGYGVVLTLFVICFNQLYHNARTTKDRQSIGLLVYICFMFMFATFFIGALIKLTQNAFVDNRNYPGGPGVYENVMYGSPLSEFGNVCYNLANWAADSLLVWRCFVIYRGCRSPAWMYMTLPCMLLATSFVIGTLYLVKMASPAGNPWSDNGINFTLLYASISLSLNLFITLMIVGRLLLYRYRLVKAMGPEHGSAYVGVTTMLVESAAIYAVFSLMFIIPYGLKNALANVMLEALAEIQVVASFLIICRVAQGRALTHNTLSHMMTQQKAGNVPMMKVSHIQFVAPGSVTGGSSNTAIVNGEDSSGEKDSDSGKNEIGHDI